MRGVGSSRIISGGNPVTAQDPLRMALKIEKGQSVIGYNCVYAGGSTHPAQATTGMLVQALIRFMMLRANIDFGAIEEDMLYPGISTQTFEFYYWYRQDTRNPTALTAVPAAGDPVISVILPPAP